MKAIFRKWVNKNLQRSNKKSLLNMFLRGLKGQLQSNMEKPYGYHFKILSAILSVSLTKYLLDLRKNEMDYKGYNWFVPEYVYKVREESFIYWELSRLSKNLPTTFTHYKMGDNVMYEIDRSGEQKAFLSHSGIQNLATFGSTLHEYNFPAKPERHSQIMMYLKNINNPYDLSNHLRAKSINLGDWLRTVYYFIYRELGLTNRWRYDEFVSKPDIYYRWEKLKLAYTLSKDRKKAYETLESMEVTPNDVIKFLIWVY